MAGVYRLCAAVLFSSEVKVSALCHVHDVYIVRERADTTALGREHVAIAMSGADQDHGAGSSACSLL